MICSRKKNDLLIMSEWEIINIICCSCSVWYHILLFIYVSKNVLHNVVFLANNSIDIAVSIPQTVLIILAYSTNASKEDNQNQNQCENESFLCHLFSIIGLINMGFWLSDGIGAEWQTVLCCENTEFFLIGNRLLNCFLHFKIFFHFQTFLLCLNFLWRPILPSKQPLKTKDAILGNEVV